MARDPSDLSAYLDGELSRAESAETEAWIREDPEAAKESKRLERSRTMLAQCIERPMFHANLMQRANAAESGMRKRRIAARSLLAAAAVLLVVAAGLLILVQWPGEDHTAIDTATSGSIAPPALPVGPSSHDAGPKLAAAVPSETTTAPPALESTKLPLELMGTITGASPMAVIDVKEGPKQGSQVFQKGDAVLEGVTVVDIGQNQVVLDNNGQQTTLVCTEEAVTTTAPDLSGLWDLRLVELISGGGEERFIGRVRIEHSGNTLKLYDDEAQFGAGPNQQPAPVLVGEGRITSGRDVQFTPTMTPFDALGTVYGKFNAEWNQLVAPLGNRSPEALSIFGYDDRNPAPYYLGLKLVRLTANVAQSEQLLASRIQEVKVMVAALGRYASSHDRRYPAKLEELVPDIVPDLSSFSDTDTRKVQYIPGATSPNVSLDSFKELMKVDPSLPYPDALMKCEQALRDAGYAKIVYPQTVLKVTYSNPDVTIIGDNRNSVRAEGLQGGSADAAIRATCQNNLKQLSLVIKMFENEHRDYTPPGWLSVYPEYLADTNILTSPKDEPGTDSYLYLCPATNIKEYMIQTYADLDPAALAQVDFAQVESTIPTVMNRTDFPNPAGRNVAFADGHVTFVPTSQIPPLLNFWSRRP